METKIESYIMTIYLLAQVFSAIGALCVSYSLAIAITRNLQWLRWVIIENMLLWLIYDLTIQAYPAAVTDITITLTTLIAIIKNRKTFSK